MSEMVEKVRAALATDQMRSTLAAAGLEFEPAQDAFLEVYARAAIKAMREPTEAMIEAVEGISVGGPYLGPLDADDIYGQMIDAALIEVEG